MTGWAATNTLREALAVGWPEGDHAEPNVFTEALAALALVEAALDAAERRVKFGHDKHCAWVIGGPKPPPCDCGHDELAAALRPVREGK